MNSLLKIYEMFVVVARVIVVVVVEALNLLQTSFSKPS